MKDAPDFEFLTTKILRVLSRNPGGMLIDEIHQAVGRPKSSVKNTLGKLRSRGYVEMTYIAQYTFLYKFLRDFDRDGQPADHAPKLAPIRFSRPIEIPRVMIRDTLPRKHKSQSGTGIITPPRAAPEFKPLVRRDFYEAQRLAELTR